MWLQKAISTIDWQSWIAFFTFLSFIGVVIKWGISKLVPLRNEFELLRHDLSKVIIRIGNHESDIRGLKKDRVSFRTEVLDALKETKQDISNVASDVSELKTALIEKE